MRGFLINGGNVDSMVNHFSVFKHRRRTDVYSSGGKTGFVPDQVQDFYPTPGTLATCIYYTGRNPFTGREVYVAKDMKEKKMQRALLHFNKKENRSMVTEALKTAGREDLRPDR